jgi:hypothetical protein
MPGQRRSLMLGLSLGALGALGGPFFGCGDSFRTVGFLERRDTALPGGNPTAQVLGLGDLDGDGKLDAAVANSRNEVNVFISKGDGFFATGTVFPVENLNGGGRSIALGDFTGDGRPDVVVGNGGTRNLSIFFNGGDGRLAPSSSNPVDVGCTVVGVAIVDLDGDAQADIVLVCTNQNEVRVLRNRGGTSGFDAAYVLPYGTGQIPTPRQLAAADLDGNGQTDIVVGTEADLRVLTNPGGAMTAAVSMPLNMRAGAIAIGDVNGNGIADVSVLVGQQAVRVYEYATGGTFSQLVDYMNIGQMDRNTNQGLGVGDFLKRGRGDLVVTLPNPSEVKLVVNRGETNMVSQPTVASYEFPTVSGMTGLTVSDNGFAVGDVTGDGLPDVVLRNGSQVSVLVNAALQ